MRALHRKVLRDLLRLWPQALAIAFVMAAGVATLILAVGAHGSLAETRAEAQRGVRGRSINVILLEAGEVVPMLVAYERASVLDREVLDYL